MNSSRPSRVVIVVVLVLEIALALVLSNLYASLNNSLIANGRWESTKVAAEMPLMGVVQFVSTPQTVAHEQVDLGRWPGYQEILYREPVLLREISSTSRSSATRTSSSSSIATRNDSRVSGRPSPWPAPACSTPTTR